MVEIEVEDQDEIVVVLVLVVKNNLMAINSSFLIY